MWKWLRHAFALDSPEDFTITPEQEQVVDKLCQGVVRRRLTTPALMLLETVTPLNYVGSQAMHFFSPILSLVTDRKGHEEFARFLEQRGSIDYICQRLDALENQFDLEKAIPPEAAPNQEHSPEHPE